MKKASYSWVPGIPSVSMTFEHLQDDSDPLPNSGLILTSSTSTNTPTKWHDPVLRVRMHVCVCMCVCLTFYYFLPQVKELRAIVTQEGELGESFGWQFSLTSGII